MHCKLFSIARTVLTGGCIRNRLNTNGNEDMSLHVNLNANLITVASNALYVPLNGEQTDAIFFASAGHESMETKSKCRSLVEDEEDDKQHMIAYTIQCKRSKKLTNT